MKGGVDDWEAWGWGGGIGGGGGGAGGASEGCNKAGLEGIEGLGSGLVCVDGPRPWLALCFNCFAQ